MFVEACFKRVRPGLPYPVSSAILLTPCRRICRPTQQRHDDTASADYRQPTADSSIPRLTWSIHVFQNNLFDTSLLKIENRNNKQRARTNSKQIDMDGQQEGGERFAKILGFLGGGKQGRTVVLRHSTWRSTRDDRPWKIF